MAGIIFVQNALSEYPRSDIVSMLVLTNRRCEVRAMLLRSMRYRVWGPGCFPGFRRINEIRKMENDPAAR